jgi:hypothetical protein
MEDVGRRDLGPPRNHREKRHSKEHHLEAAPFRGRIDINSSNAILIFFGNSFGVNVVVV